MATTRILQTFYTIGRDDRSASSQHITLESKSLPITLRTPRTEDIPGMTKVMADPRNTGTDLSMSKMTRPQVEELVTKWTKLNDPLTHFPMVILLAGEVVGISGLGLVRSAKEQNLSDDPNDLCGVVGVMLNPEVRGKGFARDAVRISIDYGLRELGFLQVMLGASSENVAMRNVMEKGLKMPAVVEKADEYGNDLMWKIDPKDWLSQRHEPTGLSEVS